MLKEKLFKAVLFISSFCCLTTVQAQTKVNPDSIRNKMQWFADAKLGIFIHWGIYAVNGIDESWSFHNKKISHADYMKQMKGFTASRYNPEEWAALIKESGARYAVITTKHHDGVALWPTKEKHYNVVKNTPAKRDLLTPFYAALNKQGIKRGAYYSLIDWSYPDYPGFLKDSNRYKVADEPQRWQRFQKFNENQINEINVAFKPDLWWFDGDWEHSAEEWDAANIRKSILSLKPDAIINGRLQGYGDYDTPEQNFPVTRPKFNWWELCMTSNSSWGYQPKDTAWKTPYEVITIFADAISNGGNLLLDIGPKEDGTIPPQQIHILKELGKWNHKHEEAIFNTLGGMPQGHFYGPSTLSKDSSILYLFLPGRVNGQVVVKGLKNKIKNIRVVGTSQTLQHKIVGKISWSPVPGLVYINVPPSVQDEYMSVLAVELDGPISLYKGQGGLN
ncbi:alpha-L-fucosidase [Chitinophagaceae bacterium LB-8]|uniref:alpha-L-fucosidase n=1 Tax=Paraflavisolibacter caeni TaxID=2982496 RepID=A0A9X3BH19_9BACT|nr:alpha-L-fucosidase [Paraflavisolibacter caeni]MCU7548797.1 alpha-L-fucosidase [Paraflavisolibacter caeni]